MAQAEACQRKLDLANRLIAALASEGGRWASTVEQLRRDYQVPAAYARVCCGQAGVVYACKWCRLHPDAFVSRCTAYCVLLPKRCSLSLLQSLVIPNRCSLATCCCQRRSSTTPAPSPANSGAERRVGRKALTQKAEREEKCAMQRCCLGAHSNLALSLTPAAPYLPHTSLQGPAGHRLAQVPARPRRADEPRTGRPSQAAGERLTQPWVNAALLLGCTAAAAAASWPC